MSFSGITILSYDLCGDKFGLHLVGISFLTGIVVVGIGWIRRKNGVRKIGFRRNGDLPYQATRSFTCHVDDDKSKYNDKLCCPDYLSNSIVIVMLCYVLYME